MQGLVAQAIVHPAPRLGGGEHVRDRLKEVPVLTVEGALRAGVHGQCAEVVVAGGHRHGEPGADPGAVERLSATAPALPSLRAPRAAPVRAPRAPSARARRRRPRAAPSGSPVAAQTARGRSSSPAIASNTWASSTSIVRTTASATCVQSSAGSAPASARSPSEATTACSAERRRSRASAARRAEMSRPTASISTPDFGLDAAPAHLADELAPVLAKPAGRPREAEPVRVVHVLADGAQVALAQPLGPEHRAPAADQLAVLVSEQLLRPLVHEVDRAVRPHGDHGIRQSLQHGAQSHRIARHVLCHRGSAGAFTSAVTSFAASSRGGTIGGLLSRIDGARSEMPGASR